jgi:predicted naringenin-chalcone synthase
MSSLQNDGIAALAVEAHRIKMRAPRLPSIIESMSVLPNPFCGATNCIDILYLF